MKPVRIKVYFESLAEAKRVIRKIAVTQRYWLDDKPFEMILRPWPEKTKKVKK